MSCFWANFFHLRGRGLTAVLSPRVYDFVVVNIPVTTRFSPRDRANFVHRGKGGGGLMAVLGPRVDERIVELEILMIS